MAKRRRGATAAAGVKEEPEATAVKEEPLDGVKDEPQDDQENGGLTEYELERARIIQRNRERLAALGIPGLMAAVKQEVGPERKQAKPKAPRVKRVKREAAEEEEGGARRSTRLRGAAAKKGREEEAEEARLEREVGEFIVDGECPRCGKVFERGHRAHLAACTGERPKAERAPRPPKIEGLSAEDAQDKEKVLAARMKQLALSGLVDSNDEAARFVVVGSRGNHYTVTLKDGLHSCECMDWRFRRHHCKHICLVLSQLGILAQPTHWREAVEGSLSELVQQRRERRAAEPPEAEPPLGKEAQMALRFLD